MSKPKGINTAKKGWRKERACRQILEQQGYNIVFKSIRWRYGTLDFAKLFDIVAIRIIDAHPEWLFISNKHATGGSRHPQHQEAIKAFKNNLSISFMFFELWLWHAPKWRGRGSNRAWHKAKWEVIRL